MTRSEWVLKSRPYLLDPDLLQQLRKDAAAQDKAGSDLVSLDGDPFLGADGPAERYNVGKVTTKSGRCWAEVHATWDGKKSETPDVTPELVFKNGRWHFTNFYFPSPSDPKAWNVLDGLRAIRKAQKEFGSRSDKKH